MVGRQAQVQPQPYFQPQPQILQPQPQILHPQQFLPQQLPPQPQPQPQPTPPRPLLPKVGKKLFIGGIRNQMTEAMLRGHFGQFGNVTALDIVSRDGRRRGFGFVSFETCEESAR